MQRVLCVRTSLPTLTVVPQNYITPILNICPHLRVRIVKSVTGNRAEIAGKVNALKQSECEIRRNEGEQRSRQPQQSA